MPKLIILILFLTASICSAQSPDDHVVYPDTSLVIGTWGKPSDMSTEVKGIRTTLEIRPEDYYPNQNKPAMKKFQYTKLRCDYTDVIKECDRLGLEGWEAVSVISFCKSLTTDIYFKREIQ